MTPSSLSRCRCARSMAPCHLSCARSLPSARVDASDRNGALGCPGRRFQRRLRARRGRRSGASTVEFAIVAPIFFLTVLALVQFAGLLMNQNVLTAAARAGGRMASMPSTSSSSAVIAAAKDRAQRGGISPSSVTVTVTPSTLGTLNAGDEIRVFVSAPISEMTWFWVLSSPGGNLTSELTYLRE